MRRNALGRAQFFVVAVLQSCITVLLRFQSCSPAFFLFLLIVEKNDETRALHNRGDNCGSSSTGFQGAPVNVIFLYLFLS